MPVARIVRIRVDKRFPAKGSGGSSLTLICTDGASATQESSIDVSEGAHPDEMDTAALQLGKRLGKPVVIGIAHPDD